MGFQMLQEVAITTIHSDNMTWRARQGGARNIPQWSTGRGDEYSSMEYREGARNIPQWGTGMDEEYSSMEYREGQGIFLNGVQKGARNIPQWSTGRGGQTNPC